MPKNKSINLLPQEEFNITTTGRILKWATGTFRIIVIITEMVVMAAFLSRFWLDAQNSTLNDSIKIKSAQITAQGDLEENFRNIQSKLNIYSQVSASGSLSEKIDKVTSKLPFGVTLSGISVSDSSGQIKGTAASDILISQFIANLQNDAVFKKVELEQIGSLEGNLTATVFTINIAY
jgi:Tfp pilus assembly protein PilN